MEKNIINLKSTRKEQIIGGQRRTIITINKSSIPSSNMKKNIIRKNSSGCSGCSRRGRS